MADIDLHFLALGDLKQQYLELDLRAGRPLIYGSERFSGILFFIFGWSGIDQFLAAVYFSAYDFYETSSAC